jgi:hypothetical protein
MFDSAIPAARRQIAERLFDVIFPAKWSATDSLIEALEDIENLASMLASIAEIDAEGRHCLSSKHVQTTSRMIERQIKIARFLSEFAETPHDCTPAASSRSDQLSLLANVCFNLSPGEREILKSFAKTLDARDPEEVMTDLIQRGLRDVLNDGGEGEA